jgi:hypothetical protein
MPQHRPMIPKHLLLLRLRETVRQFLHDCPMEFSVNASSANSGLFLK